MPIWDVKKSAENRVYSCGLEAELTFRELDKLDQNYAAKYSITREYWDDMA